jgi:large subunit ribosomal protein L52
MLKRTTAFMWSMRAGQKARLAKGLPRSNNELGSDLFDQPDWSYADGRPAPVRVSVEKAINKKRVIDERIARLQSEMDVLLEDAVRKEQEYLEEKKSNDN